MDSFVAAPAELALLAACLKKKSYKSLELVARDSQKICTGFFLTSALSICMYLIFEKSILKNQV